VLDHFTLDSHSITYKGREFYWTPSCEHTEAVVKFEKFLKVLHDVLPVSAFKDGDPERGSKNVSGFWTEEGVSRKNHILKLDRRKKLPNPDIVS
jgi:hypothetical protein